MMRMTWTHFRTLTEKSWLAEYTSQWQEKYYDMKDAIFVLNQNPKCHRTWVPSDGMTTNRHGCLHGVLAHI